MMPDSFVKLNEIDASLQEFSIGNKKCGPVDDDDAATGVMIPLQMWRILSNSFHARKYQKILQLYEDFVPFFTGFAADYSYLRKK